MNYEWIQTVVMALIFISAMLFAVKHFAPNAFAQGWRLVARKSNSTIDINLVATTLTSSCQTKCSACNACSLAK